MLKRLGDVFEKKYKEIIASGIVLALLALLIYKYDYAMSSDEVVGLIGASALFLSIVLIGQGIRGWRDVAQWQSKFVTMRTKKGVHLSIKKRQKKKWR